MIRRDGEFDLGMGMGMLNRNEFLNGFHLVIEDALFFSLASVFFFTFLRFYFFF